MQMLFRAFLAIYLAHLLADFVFQTARLVEQKRRGKAAGYLLHGLIHYFSAVIITGFVLRGSMLLPRTHVVILGLTLLHLLIDFAKMQLARKYPLGDGSLAYISDQLLQRFRFHVIECVHSMLLFSIASQPKSRPTASPK